jgi:hypothetical protein
MITVLTVLRHGLHSKKNYDTLNHMQTSDSFEENALSFNHLNIWGISSKYQLVHSVKGIPSQYKSSLPKPK